MEVDPLASMRCWAITVQLGGREFEIPALPAVDWWPVLVGADLAGILDMIPSSPADDLDTMLLDGTLSGKDLGETLTEVVEEATGRSFHVAFVLATVASSSWPVIGGLLSQAGFRWDQQSIGAALDAIYAAATSILGKEDLEKFHAMLENETLTQPGKKRTPSQRVTAEFESMAGPRPAPAPVPAKSTAAQFGSARPRTRTRPRQPRQGARSGAPKPQP